MSTRPQFKPQIVIPNAQGMPANGSSMAGNITSVPTIISNLSIVSYSLSWSGTSPVGTVSVQVSNDYSLSSNGQPGNPGTWNTLTLNYNGSAVTTVPVSGNTGNGFLDVEITGAYAIRLIYTAISGTGTLQAIINSKVA